MICWVLTFPIPEVERMGLFMCYFFFYFFIFCGYSEVMLIKIEGVRNDWIEITMCQLVINEGICSFEPLD